MQERPLLEFSSMSGTEPGQTSDEPMRQQASKQYAIPQPACDPSSAEPRRSCLGLLLQVMPLLLVLVIDLVGCASMATQRLAGSISSAMLNQDDPATVLAGAPAYLLLLDGLINDNPQDLSLLIAGARLYQAFGAGLVKDPERSQRLTAKSRDYARRAMCIAEPELCHAEQKDFETFSRAVEKIQVADLDVLYAYGTSWAGWIQVRTNDWHALAELPRVEALLERVIALDPGYDRGRSQLYLGVMRSQLPQAMGGKPETGRKHFELALQYSGGRDLMAKVEYARHYARLVFDQTLHDRLLHEVLEADPVEPNLTLSNVLAQLEARRLLDDTYF